RVRRVQLPALHAQVWRGVDGRRGEAGVRGPHAPASERMADRGPTGPADREAHDPADGVSRVAGHGRGPARAVHDAAAAAPAAARSASGVGGSTRRRGTATDAAMVEGAGGPGPGGGSGASRAGARKVTATTRVEALLVIYHHDLAPNAATILDHIHSF